MRPVDYIALAIPVFFALIGIEWLWARVRGERLYRLNDSIADLSTGILDQTVGVFTKAVTVGVYAFVWDRFRVAEWDAGTISTWVVCFLGVDFFYYWFHRVSHESNLAWGAHIVHHSSEEYNLSVALRQGALQSFFSFPFYLPLAWLGFPPLVFLACSSFDTLYQFWIHTRTIGRLGPLEWVLNTPSLHRVHHGCDPKYIDRNYAGTLIVWDRLFGSFQARLRNDNLQSLLVAAPETLTRLGTHPDSAARFQEILTGLGVPVRAYNTDARNTDALSGLARQYLGYGRWKREVLRRHPRSVRPRQLAAPAGTRTLDQRARIGEHRRRADVVEQNVVAL